MPAVTQTPAPASPVSAPSQPERCAVCGAILLKDGVFCTNCGALRASLVGKPLPYAPSRTWVSRQYPGHRTTVSWRVTSKSIAAILILSMVVMTFLMLFTLLYGIAIVGPAILDGTGHLSSYGMFIVLPILVTILTLSGAPLFAYYIFIIFAIVLSVAWVFATSARGFAQELRGRAKSREHSALFDTYALLCASLFFTEATVLLLILLGMDTGTSISTGNLADSLFLLANAAVWEEIAVRVLLIGMPLLVVDLVRRRLQARPHRYVLGGGFKFGTPETVLVVISAIIFGIAHWVGGWPPWKIPDAAVAGLAFGYLFLKHGLPSAILLHFVNDYLTMPSDVFSTNTGALWLITVLLVFMWAIIGSAFFVYYLTRIVEFVTGRRLLEQRPVAVGVPGVDPRFYGPYPQPYAYAPHPLAQTTRPSQTYGVVPGQTVGHGYSGGYVCPACGNTQARWIDGKFECLRCGNIS